MVLIPISSAILPVDPQFATTFICKIVGIANKLLCENKLEKSVMWKEKLLKAKLLNTSIWLC